MRGGKLTQALGCVARPLFGFYFKNETGSFMLVYFNAECSKMSQYHFKYLNLGHRLAHVSPKQHYF